MEKIIEKIGQAVVHQDYRRADSELTKMMSKLKCPSTAYSLGIQLKKSLKFADSQPEDSPGADWKIKTELEKLVQVIVGY